MSADDDVKAKEASALFKIHGVDQRSAELAFSHRALGGDESTAKAKVRPARDTGMHTVAVFLSSFPGASMQLSSTKRHEKQEILPRRLPHVASRAPRARSPSSLASRSTRAVATEAASYAAAA